MSAFAFESPNKVWQRARIALAASNAAVQKQMNALKEYLSTQAGNPDLGFYPFLSTSVDDAGGHLLATGAARILAVYGKKAATATDVFLWAIDDVDDDSTLSTKGNIMLPFLESGEQNLFVSPVGVSFGIGLVIKAYTTPLGTTDSTDTDCPSGFVIVKAA